MIYDDYIRYTAEYCAKYGERTLVLMEVGSFFEIYAVDNETEKAGADMVPICDLLNLQVSRKNKTIVENHRGNPLMAGFPSFALSKHVQTLLANQYTVVVIRQVTPPPNPRREVTDIFSPSMQLQPNGLDGNFLMVMYWDVAIDVFQKRFLNVGMCGMDVSTGTTWVYEVASPASDPSLAMDELVRCFQMYQPREVVFIGPRLNAHEREQIELAVGATYDASRVFHARWEDPSLAEFQKVVYQNATLERAFPNTGLLAPVDALGLERYENARTAFVYMIQFGFEHSKSIVEYLHQPTHMVQQSRCTLEYNSAIQLNVVSQHAGERPLMHILNRCATAFGARTFRAQLLEPTFDAEELQQRYNAVDDMLTHERYQKVHHCLKSVFDLERMSRRMRLGSFSPCDWTGYDTSLHAIAKVGQELDMQTFTHKVHGLIEDYASILHMDECAKYLLHDIKGNLFVRGVLPDVDELCDQRKRAWEDVVALTHAMEAGGGDACRIDFHERDGYSITMTKRRWDAVLKGNGSQLMVMGAPIVLASCSVKPISTSSSTVRVRHPWIDQRSDIILQCDQRIAAQVTTHYKSFLAEHIQKHAETLHAITQEVARIDIAATCAKNAREYHYVRPVLVQGSVSHVHATKMRHPILERLIDKHRYVPNDVALHGSAPHGLLLFGMNASGKSSLMKSVGLNVIMAQAGMFVAADAFELSPYSHIFTRITGQDNIYRGWSTFTVEMLELRNILQRCNTHSLVLGDELCAGTESLSALSIVAAGIEVLAKKQASFIFATHLHDLSRLDRVTSLSSVRMAHMHVEVDPTTGRIVYDRQLKDGSGSAVYGLEVCKGLDMPPEFLRVAHEVRCEIQGVSSRFQPSQQSRYNAKHFVGACSLCNKPSTEVHHIVPQKEADAHGFTGHFHKNRAYNLVSLCEACHLAVHKGEKVIHGYHSTSHGVELVTTQGEVQTQASSPIRSTSDEVHRSLWDVLRYNKSTWYHRKSKRGKWKPVDEGTVKKLCVTMGNFGPVDICQLERTFADVSF
jgi:DNA mismatch repair protein MutS